MVYEEDRCDVGEDEVVHSSKIHRSQVRFASMFVQPSRPQPAVSASQHRHVHLHLHLHHNVPGQSSIARGPSLGHQQADRRDGSTDFHKSEPTPDVKKFAIARPRHRRAPGSHFAYTGMHIEEWNLPWAKR